MSPDVQVALIGAIATVLVAFMEFVRRREAKKNHAVLSEMRDDLSITRFEVKNDHGTNMRADIDKLGDKLDVVIDGQRRHDDILTSHSSQLSAIQDESRLERKERILLGERVENVNGDLVILGRQLTEHVLAHS